ncbi:MAG: hypothetical protein WC666_03915 [Candidatus Paceibacterota bacterium]|jgi:hypothetical protein
MPDSKISNLTALTSVASADELVVVDKSDTTMAATGTTKKITRDNLVGSDLVALEAAFVPASSAAPASIDLAEDTDNGTNKITLTAPSAVASDKVLTLPDATDTLVGKDTTDTLTNKTLSTGSVVPVGYITNPYTFRAYKSGAAQVIATSTNTKIILESENFDPNNNFDNVTNYRYTAPVSGYYQISARVAFSTPSASVGEMFASIRKNGSITPIIHGTRIVNRIDNSPGSIVCDIQYLTATDYIELWVYQNSGANMSTENTSQSVYISAHLLGV